MNPNMELESIIDKTVLEFYGDRCEVLATNLYKSIRDWMGREGIVFYQP